MELKKHFQAAKTPNNSKSKASLKIKEPGYWKRRAEKDRIRSRSRSPMVNLLTAPDDGGAHKGDEVDNDEVAVVSLPDESTNDERVLSDSDVLMVTVDSQQSDERPVADLQNELVEMNSSKLSCKR